MARLKAFSIKIIFVSKYLYLVSFNEIVSYIEFSGTKQVCVSLNSVLQAPTSESIASKLIMFSFAKRPRRVC